MSARARVLQRPHTPQQVGLDCARSHVCAQAESEGRMPSVFQRATDSNDEDGSPSSRRMEGGSGRMSYTGERGPMKRLRCAWRGWGTQGRGQGGMAARVCVSVCHRLTPCSYKRMEAGAGLGVSVHIQAVWRRCVPGG